MDKLNGGLKDIFSTILGETETKPSTPQIVVHGNGNVIAPGGTVHYVQGTPQPTKRHALRGKEN